MNPDVLYELVVGGEGLDAVLALVRLGVVAVALPRVHLHRRLVHEDLEGETKRNLRQVRSMERERNHGGLR